jgi:NAD(P)-dependent dehydrogenase (short-subunit alcohol dehydrogenase family)
MADRAAIVTGASSGIGLAIARMLGEDGYGVTMAARRPDKLEAATQGLKDAGLDVHEVAANVADEEDIKKVVAAHRDRYGRLDVLVNNAGIAGSYGTLDSYTVEALERLWAVNLTGPFVCAREAANRMRASGTGGSIINISSKAAVLGGSFEWVHYAASKGGIDTMTTGLAKELASHGIRVNAVRPGLIESDFHLHATPGRVERMTPLIPMQRAGSADEVAEAVLWLASPSASYVTGAFIEVTGGR